MFQRYDDQMGTSDPDPETRDQPRMEVKSPSTLGRREMDVLKQLSLGHPNKIIASNLNISEQTVKNYVTEILFKLQANNRTHAVTLATKKGLL